MSIRVHLGDPHAGWMSVTLASGLHEYTFSASYTPRDSITELASALILFADIRHPSDLCIQFSLEPSWCELRITPASPERHMIIQLIGWEPSVAGFGRRSEVLFSALAERSELAITFWRALRNLAGRIDSKAYTSEWRHPFPKSEVQFLGRTLGRT